MTSSLRPFIRFATAAALFAAVFAGAPPEAQALDLLDRCRGAVSTQGRRFDQARFDSYLSAGSVDGRAEYDFEAIAADLVLEMADSHPSLAESLKKQLSALAYNERIRINEVQRSVHSGFASKDPLASYFWFDPKGGHRLQLDWPNGLALTPKQNFLLRERVLNVLFDLEYVKITQLKQLRRSPRVFFSSNVKLIRDRLMYSYILHGNAGFTPPSGWTAETIATFKRVILGSLAPDRFSSMKTARFNSFHVWVLENYGVKGLTRALYFTHSPAIAFRYAVTVLTQLQNIAALAITVALAPHVFDSVGFFTKRANFEFTQETKMKQVEEVLRYFDLDRGEIIRSVEGALDNAVAPVNPPNATETAAQAAQKAQFKKLLKEIEEELKQTEPVPAQ